MRTRFFKPLITEGPWSSALSQSFFHPTHLAIWIRNGYVEAFCSNSDWSILQMFLCAFLMILTFSCSMAQRIAEVKVELYLSSNSLHSLTRLNDSISSAIAEKAWWQMLSWFVMTLCKNLSFLVQMECRDFHPSATIAAVLEYHLGKCSILFGISPWKESIILIEPNSEHRGRMGRTHTIEQQETGVNLY